jgi:hypothetical protein
MTIIPVLSLIVSLTVGVAYVAANGFNLLSAIIGAALGGLVITALEVTK